MMSKPRDIESKIHQPSADELVGIRLRELRNESGFSLRELADRSGLNINTLSLIEHGKSSPSVSTLQQLARALEVEMGAFFELEHAPEQVVHTRACQRPLAILHGAAMHNLGKDLIDHAVQPFLVNLPPGAGSGSSVIVHTGHEFLYCLSGELTLEIEERAYLLQPGDSLVFQAHLPHRWRNDGSVGCQILLVICPADRHEKPIERHFRESSLSKEKNK